MVITRIKSLAAIRTYRILREELVPCATARIHWPQNSCGIRFNQVSEAFSLDFTASIQHTRL